MISIDLEEFINKDEESELAKNFCGIFSSNEPFTFIECADKVNSTNKTLPYAIFNTDYSNRAGTHWISVLKLQAENEIFLFGNLGYLSLNEFIYPDDVKITSTFWKKLDDSMNLKQDPVVFSTFVFNANKFMCLSPKTTKQLTDTARGIFTLFSGLALTNNKTHLLVTCIDDQMQESQSNWCGVFVLKFLWHVFKEPNIDELESFNKANLNLLKRIINKNFLEGSLPGRRINSQILNQFSRENNLKVNHKL